ncbi:MAG: thiolase family protein [Dehalococcoidia bacterium]
MSRVVVLGVGLHRFGHLPDLTVGDLTREAGLAALDDAGISYQDVEAGFFARVLNNAGVGTRCFGELGMTGIPVTNVELACASSSRGALIAADLIAGGVYDCVMVLGVEKMERGLVGGAGSQGYGARMGLGVMPAVYALMAQRHMHEYGTKPEHFGMAAVKAHRNGTMNPFAQYQKEVSLEEVMGSRLIADPITLLMCCPTTDGASALILASEEFARRHTTEPVYLSGWAGGTPIYQRGEAAQDEGSTAVLARQAYTKAGIGPEDVDVVQLHDAFTPGEIMTIEELGLCPVGEGGPFVWEGETAIGGRVPVNTDGGLNSRGHPMGATGGAMLTELTRQLREEAGPRQVEGAKVALLQNAGIGGMNVMVLTR